MLSFIKHFQTLKFQAFEAGLRDLIHMHGQDEFNIKFAKN
jgi:hypothetical protein